MNNEEAHKYAYARTVDHLMKEGNYNDPIINSPLYQKYLSEYQYLYEKGSSE